RRHTRSYGDWSSDVCSSDLFLIAADPALTIEDALAGLRTGVGTLAKLAQRKNDGTLDGTLRGFVRDFAYFLLRSCIDRPCNERRSEERRVGKECRTRGWTRR